VGYCYSEHTKARVNTKAVFELMSILFYSNGIIWIGIDGRADATAFAITNE